MEEHQFCPCEKASCIGSLAAVLASVRRNLMVAHVLDFFLAGHRLSGKLIVTTRL